MATRTADPAAIRAAMFDDGVVVVPDVVDEKLRAAALRAINTEVRGRGGRRGERRESARARDGGGLDDEGGLIRADKRCCFLRSSPPHTRTLANANSLSSARGSRRRRRSGSRTACSSRR